MQSATALLSGNLPAEPNSFIGRERDLAELARLLGEVRALTLSGPGGIGKTRLAIRLARDVITGSRYPGTGPSNAAHPDTSPSDTVPSDTVPSDTAPSDTAPSDTGHPGTGEGTGDLDEAWLVDLADWHGPTAQRVAATIGVREEPGVPLPHTLAEALRSRRMLLILDTCEHQVSDCATLVQLLLARCPWLRVIATSREPLRVRGETVWRVPPLDLPPDNLVDGAELADHEAVQLFAVRAAGARPGFALTQDNTASVARLCRTLDGIPLGIELSAARVRALSVEQIADRLHDRFQLLNSGDRTAPLRQQTLRATVDWSYELLDEAEQMLLRRLAVFSGWNLDMAEQVCSDMVPSAEGIPADAVLGLLISLIDKSLVVLDGEAAGDARYRLLDTIKQYAAERLAVAGEQDALSLRHRYCILSLVERTAEEMFNRGEPPWPVRREVYRRGIAEYGNFRIALTTSLAHGHLEEGLRLCIGLRNMWVPHGDQREAASWFDRFLARDVSQVSPRVLGRALACRADIAFDLQDYDTLVRCASQGLELSRKCGDDFAVPAGLRVLAQAALRAARFGEAVAYADEAHAAAETTGNDWEAGLALAAKAAVAVRQGKLKSAQRAYETALEVLSDNNHWGVAQVEYGMGTLARARDDAEMAVRYFAGAMEIFRELDAWPEIARCQAGIGWVAMASGDFGLAADSLAEALRLNQAGGQRLGVARGLEAFAALAAARQQPEQAARLAGAACQLRESLGHPAGIGPRIEEVLELARGRLGASAAAALFAEGRELTAEDAVRYALGSDQVMSAPVPSGTRGASPLPGPTRVPGSSRAAAAPRSSGTSEPAWTDPARLGAVPGPRHDANGHRAPSPLTPREHEIVLLIAQGLSNRQIADELVISPATAARHVANILAKLGFTSRTQVASWATRHEPPS
ncbi:MAG: tetratricopeptide repeat protein [Actinobacteria bacterium]|nr:tetratricopeptide repeat protein [Actinomycetota bacterium]